MSVIDVRQPLFYIGSNNGDDIPSDCTVIYLKSGDVILPDGKRLSPLDFVWYNRNMMPPGTTFINAELYYYKSI